MPSKMAGSMNELMSIGRTSAIKERVDLFHLRGGRHLAIRT